MGLRLLGIDGAACVSRVVRETSRGAQDVSERATSKETQALNGGGEGEGMRLQKSDGDRHPPRPGWKR